MNGLRYADTWDSVSHIVDRVGKDGRVVLVLCGAPIPVQTVYNAPNPGITGVGGGVCERCKTLHDNRHDPAAKLAKLYTNKLAGRRRR